MTDGDRTGLLAGSDALEPGTHLNDTYEIDVLIATGGMGQIYRGHNIETGEPVAIKTIRTEFASDTMIFSLFRKEAMMVARLHHPNIVRYYSFSRDPTLGMPYLAMEFVEGPSLAERIADTPLSIDEARRLFLPVAQGLALAHRAGIVHRDLSPDNIILDNGAVDAPKIIDFGIARQIEGKATTLIGSKFAGKFNFVSPEQLGLAGGEVTAKSDLYSLGLVMAASLTGRPLDMQGSLIELIEKRQRLPDLQAIPSEICGILQALLQPDPSRRPANATDVAAMLRGDMAVTLLVEPPAAAPEPARVTPPADEPPVSDHSQLPDTTSIPPRLESSIPPLVPPSNPPWSHASAVAASTAPIGSAPAGSTPLSKPPLSSHPPAMAGDAELKRSSPPDAQGANAPATAWGRRRLLIAGLATVGVIALPVAWWVIGTGPQPLPSPPPTPNGCFFALYKADGNSGPSATHIRGIGQSREPFEKIRDTLAQAGGGQGVIDASAIFASQCAAADFLNAIRADAIWAPISVAGGRGGTAEIRVGNPNAEAVTLLLVDKTGAVWPLNDFSTERAEFGNEVFKVDFSGIAPPAEPAIVLALVTPLALAAPPATPLRHAADYLPELQQQLKAADHFGVNFAPWGDSAPAL
ncbi:serine/threonine protein kinase [Mesorhizobium sp. BR1-1-16]|uniref:serine/threonine-protein kinase n=1 Tax=Mesorhizobium sp. BR1-1-16 TaxID=2876653 RepID=UPI001CC9F1F2|nr:serine/threonine-protein kinase [Mesorhizobium sp. BR1-1-16]MBZ9938990.1 serine/threonine protein kinase [Mesorhizobium sp. BR1-1-16]